jgi:hypothetical protein
MLGTQAIWCGQFGQRKYAIPIDLVPVEASSVAEPQYRRGPCRRGADQRRPDRAIGPRGAAAATQAWPQHIVSRLAQVTRACLAAALPAAAGGRFAGRAHVIDGDTIVVGDIHVRLKGALAAPQGLAEAVHQVELVEEPRQHRHGPVDAPPALLEGLEHNESVVGGERLPGRPAIRSSESEGKAMGRTLPEPVRTIRSGTWSGLRPLSPHVTAAPTGILVDPNASEEDHRAGKQCHPGDLG